MNDPGGVAVSGIFLSPSSKSLYSCGMAARREKKQKAKAHVKPRKAKLFLTGRITNGLLTAAGNKKAGAFASAYCVPGSSSQVSKSKSKMRIMSNRKNIAGPPFTD